MFTPRAAAALWADRARPGLGSTCKHWRPLGLQSPAALQTVRSNGSQVDTMQMQMLVVGCLGVWAHGLPATLSWLCCSAAVACWV